MDRRKFLEIFWKGSLAVLGIEAGVTSWALLRPRVSGGFGATVSAGAAEGLEEGTVSYVADGRLYVSKVGDEILALYQKCTHLGCRVPFCETSGRFECPCHGSVFNRKGEYLKGPAPRGMDRFRVSVEEGEILVDTSTVLEGTSRSVRTLDEEAKGPSCLGQIEEQTR